jgi:hypothetical protein
MGIPGGAARRAQKIAAIAAAGVVLLGGATITSLAAWTDSEYVVGGFDGNPGIGTSTFEVEQNTIEPVLWVNEEEAPGGVIDFGLGALSLSPGATVYGWVQLRTSPTSTVGGTLTLNGAFDDQAPDSPLFTELTYGAKIVALPGNCDQTGFDGSATIVAAVGSALSAAGGATFVLDAIHTPKTVCFAVTLDSGAPDTLQGEVTSPVWNFSAISD